MSQPQKYSLVQLISDPELTPDTLFSYPDIVTLLKSKIQLFVDYCIRNENFTYQMIKKGIHTPPKNQSSSKSAQKQPQSPPTQQKAMTPKVSDRKKINNIIQILTYENQIVCGLFIIDKSKQRIRFYSDDDDDNCQEIISDSQTGQLTIAQNQSNQQKSDFTYKFRNLKYLLSYLTQQNTNKLDENCINYISKVLNSLIHYKSQDIYQLLDYSPEFIKILVNMIQYPSISFTLVKIINQTDTQQHRQQKLSIVKAVINKIKQNIKSSKSSKQNASQQDYEIFTRYLQFVQQVFNKNRFRAQEMDQIKIVTQQFVQKDIIEFMVNHILTTDPKQNKNIINKSIAYLLEVMLRINMDEEKDPYSYTDQPNLEPTMNFECQSIYINLNKLISTSKFITRQHYKTRQILNYYQLLDGITKNSRFNNKSFYVSTEQENQTNIVELLEAYLKQDKLVNGIIKGRILQIVQRIFLHDIKSKQQPKQQSKQQNKSKKQTKKQTKQQTKQQTKKQTKEKTKQQTQQNFNYLLESQKIIDCLKKIKSRSRKQGISYYQKLKVLFSAQKKPCQQQFQKYTSSLIPNAYTSNRQYKVSELDFAFRKKKQCQIMQRKNTEQQIVDNVDLPPLQMHCSGQSGSQQSDSINLQVNSPVFSPSSNTKGVNINIKALDFKIQVIKDRKHSKQQDNDDENNRKSSQEIDDQDMPENIPQRSPKIVSNGNRIQISRRDRQLATEYYAKHLLLF